MKTVWIVELVCALPLTLLLAACAGEQSKEQPKQPSPAPIAAPARPAAEPRPVVQPAVPANPLHDPGGVLARRSVYYAFDKSDVTEEFRPVVEAHAKYLREHPGRRLRSRATPTRGAAASTTWPSGSGAPKA